MAKWMKDKIAPKTQEEVMRVVKDKEVKFINLWFVDILGKLKSFAITERELENAFSDGMGFDGSSIEGFARIYESDLVAKPDPTTFCILPWSDEGAVIARMYCDITYPGGKPYEGDTRYALKLNLEKAKELGYTMYTGPELEYFYFKDDKKPVPIDSGGYFDLISLDIARDLRRNTILYLESMGIMVEYSHHEVAASQHEIDLRYQEALTMADSVMTYKAVVKHVAFVNGYYASFMPKPIPGINGSGMHTHQSLFVGGKNAFFDPSDKDHLSQTARYYIAGVLKHAKEMTAVTNQWINSYKRLVPGYEAPVYISWGRKNRSALVRVPVYRPGKENATRIELRFPDPACNPYLAFTVMLAAGLEGIKNKYPLPDSIEKDIFIIDEQERKEQGIDTLPGSLIEALEVFETSELMKKALGEHVFNKFLENKKIEWDNYRKDVSSYEIEKYLPVL
ncbi:MAG: glutamine synthetase family protein [bacterium]